MGNSIALEVRAIRVALGQLQRKRVGRFEHPTVSLGEAAATLRKTQRELAAMIITGEIRVTRVERRKLVPVSELKRLGQNH